jgi:mRNA-degrading endonuclease HigB of HigAB toxin-antitoxin module
MSAQQIKVGGEKYTLVVLQVLERDEFGRPSQVKVGYDDTVFNIQGNEQFVTAYIHAHAGRAATKGSA